MPGQLSGRRGRTLPVEVLELGIGVFVVLYVERLSYKDYGVERYILFTYSLNFVCLIVCVIHVYVCGCRHAYSWRNATTVDIILSLSTSGF